MLPLTREVIDELSRTNFHREHKVGVPERITLAQLYRWLVFGFAPLPRSIELQLAHLPIFDYGAAQSYIGQIVSKKITAKTMSLLESGLLQAKGYADNQEMPIPAEYWQIPRLTIDWYGSFISIKLHCLITAQESLVNGVGSTIRANRIAEEHNALPLLYKEINLFTEDVIQAFDGDQVTDDYVLNLKGQVAERTHAIAGGNAFLQQGKNWRILYQGKEINMPDGKGMAYIRYLLLHPNKDVAAIELQGLRNKIGNSDNATTAKDSLPRSANDELLDAQAIQEITKRISLLPAGSSEREQLKAYILKSTHSGKSKAFKDANEKARQAVAAAVNRAIKTIYEAHEPLGKHLENSIAQGKVYTYRPELATNWQ